MPDMTAADPAALPPRADLERRLREQTAELEGVYANAPVGLCVLDRDLRWVRINKLLADMNGFPPEAHIGRSVRELLPDLADQAERILRGVLDAGAALRDQMIIGETPSRPGERRVWVEHFYPLRDATQAIVGVNVVCEEVTERQRTAERLRESEERLALALEAGELGLWDWDIPSGRVVFGGCWASMLGYDLAELEPHQRTWERLLHPDDRDAVFRVLGEHLSGKSPLYACEHRLRHKDGSWRWILDRGKVVARDQAGQPLRAVGTHTDVTALKAAQQAAERAEAEARSRLAEARRAAEARERMEDVLRDQDRRKDEFLATLAHELRNPLAPIRTGVAVLRRSGAAPPGTVAARTVDMMERQLGHLVHLVDDLLDLSRVSSGKIALRRERVTIHEIVDAAVEACRPFIDARWHALQLDVAAGPLVIDGDRTRLAQVLSNLLTNAAKYTDEGGRVTLRAAPSDREVVFSVTDTGVGLTPEAIPTLWDLFTQVRDTLDKAQGGLGIGLTLVRRLVEMHGGSVSARSEGLGRGSTFTVRLPLADDARDGQDAAGGSPVLGAGAGPRAARRRILVVDDNIDGAESLAEMLELFGHQLMTAHSGPAALDLARARRPEVVLCDIGLPGMSGYEVARALRADPETADALLVAVTGWGSEDDKRKSREAGFDRHLTKPVEAEALLAMLSGLDDPT